MRLLLDMVIDVVREESSTFDNFGGNFSRIALGIIIVIIVLVIIIIFKKINKKK